MLEFRDFAPQPTGRKLSGRLEFENSLRDSVSEASRWIDAENINVLNIETVVLPSIWAEKSTEAPELSSLSPRYQLVRVWFRT